MTLNPEQFRAALGRFASGVTVVTCVDAAGTPHGLTVSSFCSVSLEPPLILVCIARKSEFEPALAEAGHFAIHLLDETQEALSRRFSERTPGDNPFPGLAVTPGRHGVPIFAGALARLECRTVSRHAAGDHTIFVAEVESATTGEGSPLLYFRGAYRRLEP